MHGNARPQPRVGAGAAALAGAVGAGVALGVDELVAGLTGRSASLVVAVGDLVIDSLPGGAIRLGIATLGERDKPALLALIALCSVVIGAVGVAMARRRARRVAVTVLFGAFGVVGATAAARLPGTDLLDAGGRALVAASAGVAVCLALLRQAPTVPPLGAGGAATDRARAADPTDPPASRRSFLTFAGIGTLAAVGAAGTGHRLRRGAHPVVAGGGTLPAPVAGRSAPPVTATLDGQVEGLSPWVTSNADFYRIDTALVVPRVDVSSWRLELNGLVDRPLSFSYDELLALPLVEEDITLACVSNEVGGTLVGTTRWLGVALAELFERAGVQPGATQVLGRSVDGFTAGFPTGLAIDGRNAMVAVGMGGEVLPTRHGFPARIIVPGLYGYVSATKWLRRIELTTWEAEEGYWIPRGWSREGPMKTQSRIDVPRRGNLRAGPTTIAGVAWAPVRGVQAVEVRVDDGPWRPARLGGTAGPQTWVQWVLPWDATPGKHRLEVRATDGTGAVQTDERRPPVPDGATGYHFITLDVD